MRLLIDTHVLLWWQSDNPRLGQRVRALLADPKVSVVVSAVSFWELAVKHRKGKLGKTGSQVWAEALDDGFEVLAVAANHLAALEGLPLVPEHKDPFDHLLLAQAKAEDMPIVTGDRQMTSYGVSCIGVR